MKKVRRGFTLVEVSLFLAITAMVFVGIAVGTQNSIFQQRYNDSVQNFAEFLRSVYSQVTNVQSEGTGRSDKAIYGKLVIFGESGDGGNNIASYNVIGDVRDFGVGGDVLGSLRGLKVSIFENDNPVGYVEKYKPRWGAQIQDINVWDDGYKIFKGALLVVRHPSSGTVYTFVSTDESMVEDLTSQSETLASYMSEEYFQLEEMDFCVNPNGAGRSDLRRDVRIAYGARNASGVEILGDEAEIIYSLGRPVNIGNRCNG